MFDVDDFVASCVACMQEPEPRQAIREELSRVVSRTGELTERLPPETAGITLLYNTPELTIINVVWAPGMRLFAHDHRMWAAIGIFTGAEDNEFFRRNRDPEGTLTASGGKRLEPGDVTLLGESTVHAVSNPASVPTGALHIYGGDFVRQPRSQWVPPELQETPYSNERVARVFATANEAWRAGGEQPTV